MRGRSNRRRRGRDGRRAGRREHRRRRAGGRGTAGLGARRRARLDALRRPAAACASMVSDASHSLAARCGQGRHGILGSCAPSARRQQPLKHRILKRVRRHPHVAPHPASRSPGACKTPHTRMWRDQRLHVRQNVRARTSLAAAARPAALDTCSAGPAMGACARRGQRTGRGRPCALAARAAWAGPPAWLQAAAARRSTSPPARGAAGSPPGTQAPGARRKASTREVQLHRT